MSKDDNWPCPVCQLAFLGPAFVADFVGKPLGGGSGGRSGRPTHGGGGGAIGGGGAGGPAPFSRPLPVPPRPTCVPATAERSREYAGVWCLNPPGGSTTTEEGQEHKQTTTTTTTTTTKPVVDTSRKRKPTTMREMQQKRKGSKTKLGRTRKHGSSPSGYRGITRVGGGNHNVRWQAQIAHPAKKNQYLGTFDSEVEARQKVPAMFFVCDR